VCEACCKPYLVHQADCDACADATCGHVSAPPTGDDDDEEEEEDEDEDDEDEEDVEAFTFTVDATTLLILVLLPFFGRMFFDYVVDCIYRRCCGEPEPDFPTCLDRPFVKKEIQWAEQYHRPFVTVFEEERRRQAYFDYGLAWKKYGGTQFEFILNIDSVSDWRR
jgi:hypothetical protein